MSTECELLFACIFNFLFVFDVDVYIMSYFSARILLSMVHFNRIATRKWRRYVRGEEFSDSTGPIFILVAGGDMPPFLKANPWNECEEITSLLYDSILAVNGMTTYSGRAYFNKNDVTRPAAVSKGRFPA